MIVMRLSSFAQVLLVKSDVRRLPLPSWRRVCSSQVDHLPGTRHSVSRQPRLQSMVCCVGRLLSYLATESMKDGVLLRHVVSSNVTSLFFKLFNVLAPSINRQYGFLLYKPSLQNRGIVCTAPCTPFVNMTNVSPRSFLCWCFLMRIVQ